MDLGTQTRIMEIGKTADDKPVVLLGSPDPDSTEITALTVTTGDPTYSGPLAGVQLGLPVFHVLEESVEAASDANVYEHHVGVMREALDTDGIRSTMERLRNA
jgi:hypothetical protein